MARNFGRIFSSIWDDEDFQALSRTAQCQYVFLLSQSDLEHSGVIPLRERRWAKSCNELTSDRVTEDLKALEASRFIEVDEDTEELLVRSLIRRDEVWKQPNVFKSAAASVRAVKSPRIKAVLHDELKRLDLSKASAEVVRVRDELLAHLEPFAKGSRGVAEGSGKGSHLPQGNGEGNGGMEEVLPSPLPLSTSSSEPASQPAGEPIREDVERICTHLADRIEQNGSKRPTIGKKWRDAARLMLDRDGRTEEQIHKAIDWCQDDSFWKSNIMSMPKLREKYDTLRLRAQEQQKKQRGSPGGEKGTPSDIKPRDEWMYRS